MEPRGAGTPTADEQVEIDPDALQKTSTTVGPGEDDDDEISISKTLDQLHLSWLNEEMKLWMSKEPSNSDTIRDHLKKYVHWELGFVHDVFEVTEAQRSRRTVKDVYIVSKTQSAPTIIVESGTENIEEELESDMKAWMRYGKEDVKMGIVFIWTMHQNGVVGGRLKIFDYDTEKSRMVKEMTFLPPTDLSYDEIPMTLGAFCGRPLTEEGMSIKVPFAIDRLRTQAIEAIKRDEFKYAHADLEDGLNSDPSSSNLPLDSQSNTPSYVNVPAAGNVGSFNQNSNNSYNITIVQNITNTLDTMTLPKTVADNLTLLTNLVNQLGLDKSQYPPGPDGMNAQIETLAKKATENGPPTVEKLGLHRRAVIDLTAVSIYDVIIFADDSSSMTQSNKRKTRYSTLKDAIKNLSVLATGLNKEGISLRFLNHKNEESFDGLTDESMIDKVLTDVKPNGASQLGTNLQNKVIQPLLNRAKDEDFKRPVLIIIITDGEPNWEPRDEMKKAIIECKRRLKEELSYSGTEIIFQISYVGTEKSAKKFMYSIENDPSVKDLLYCNPDNIENLINNRGPGEASRNLLRLLRSAIIKAPLSL